MDIMKVRISQSITGAVRSTPLPFTATLLQPAREHCVERGRSLSLQVEAHVTVHIHCDPDATMSQHGLHHLRRDSLLKQPGGIGMPGVVQPDRWQARPLQRLAEGAVIDRSAIRPTKHQALVCVAWPKPQLLLSLLRPMVSERRLADVWQRNSAPGIGSLGLLCHQFGPPHGMILRPHQGLTDV